MRSARAAERTGGRFARGFISPATATVLLLSIFPLVFSLGITFTNVNLFRRKPVEFVGLDNWARLMQDGALRTTLFNTLVFVVGGVAIQYVLGLALALVLDRGIRGRRTLRVLFLLPMMVSPIAVGFIIGRMMLGEGSGPVNHLLTQLGLPAISWLGSPAMARLSIILVDTWQWTPLIFVLLLAGLQNVPSDVLEAAGVDGANEWQLFRHITFPLLLPISITAVLIRGLEAFKIIDIIRVVTGGGPGRATESATVYVYDLGAKQGDVAYAAAAAYALLIATILFSAVALLAMRRVKERWAT